MTGLCAERIIAFVPPCYVSLYHSDGDEEEAHTRKDEFVRRGTCNIMTKWLVDATTPHGKLLFRAQPCFNWRTDLFVFPQLPVVL